MTLQTRFTRLTDRHFPTSKTEEIVPKEGIAELTELPEEDSVKIAGLQEVPYLPTSDKEFYVQYGTSTIYVSEKITDPIKVDYIALGSVLRAKEFNALQQALEDLMDAVRNNLLNCLVTPLSSPGSRVVVNKGLCYIYPRIPVRVPAQELEVTLVPPPPPNTFCGVCITVDTGGNAHAITGRFASTPDEVSGLFDKNFSVSFKDHMLLAEIVCEVDGEGKMLPIEDKHITDLRPMLSAGSWF